VGSLNNLLAYCDVRNVEPDISIAEGLLSSVAQPRHHKMSAKQIINIVASYFQLPVKEMVSAGRGKELCHARHIATHLLRTELDLSYPKIASELGRKDHTTMMSSFNKIDKAAKDDYLVREQLSDIKEKLYAN
jgi:chromosomal replication initiator protein